MSLNHAIDHPRAVDSRALIDFFWPGQAVPPLPTQRPSIVIFVSIPLLSRNVSPDLFPLCLDSQLFQTWQRFDFLSSGSAPSSDVTPRSWRGYQITKKKAADSVSGTDRVFNLGSPGGQLVLPQWRWCNQAQHRLFRRRISHTLNSDPCKNECNYVSPSPEKTAKRYANPSLHICCICT